MEYMVDPGVKGPSMCCLVLLPQKKTPDRSNSIHLQVSKQTKKRNSRACVSAPTSLGRLMLCNFVQNWIPLVNWGIAA